MSIVKKAVKNCGKGGPGLKGGLKPSAFKPAYLESLKREAPETLKAPMPKAFNTSANYQAAMKKFKSRGNWATEAPGSPWLSPR